MGGFASNPLTATDTVGTVGGVNDTAHPDPQAAAILRGERLPVHYYSDADEHPRYDPDQRRDDMRERYGR